MSTQVDLWSSGYRGDMVQLPLLQALASETGLDQRAVFSDQSPSCAGFEQSGVPLLTLSGDRRALAAPAIPWRVARTRSRLRHWYRDRRPIVHVTMGSIWDHLYLDVPKRQGATILLTVHNARPRIGEEVGRIAAMMEDRLIRLADHIAVLSDYAGEQMAARIGRRRPIHVVAPGLVMDTRPPGPPKVLESVRPLKFLFFGRMEKYKGLGLLLTAWEMLAKSTGIPMTLTIAGSGDISQHLPAIARLPRVEVMNSWLSDETMSELFATHDVNLLPYSEGSTSATSLAGMWAGMPTIASPIGGFKEQLIPGLNALIMREVSAEALVDCILQISGSSDLYNRLAQGAHRQAHALSGPVVAKNWRDLYEGIWAEKRMSR
jgi:glycosyltransferase involved in cell wall biosynthesis